MLDNFMNVTDGAAFPALKYTPVLVKLSANIGVSLVHTFSFSLKTVLFLYILILFF